MTRRKIINYDELKMLDIGGELLVILNIIFHLEKNHQIYLAKKRDRIYVENFVVLGGVLQPNLKSVESCL